MSVAEQRQTTTAPVDQIKTALKKLNVELASDVRYDPTVQPDDVERLYRMRGNGQARSFYTEFDNDYNSWVVTIIWIVPVYPEQNEQLLNTWTELCQLGGGRVSEHVAFAYCDYVTEAEYPDRYEAPEWLSLLVEVNDAES